MAKSRWHGALHSEHKSCTHGHVFWKRGGMKRGLVTDPWTSSRRFSHVLWLKVHSHLLLRACLLGSERKLPPQTCQVRPGLPSVVCHLRGVQFPGTVYIYSQGPFSSAWAHCISCAPSACSHCRRCCCCPLQCDRQCMETHLNSAQWWRAVGWVLILGEHQPSLQTLHYTPHQHGHSSVHLHTSPAPVAQSTPPHQVFSAPTRWPSEVLNQTPSPGLQKPCRVSYWQLDTSLAAVVPIITEKLT